MGRFSSARLIALLLPALLAGCATVPTADLQSSTPLSIAMDVAPGYRDGLFLPIPEDGNLDLTIQRLGSSPSKKWKPTFYLSFDSDQSDVRYYFNLSVDTELGKMYGRLRLVDVKAQKELTNRTHQQLFGLNHRFRVSARISGKNVSIYLDGQLIDQQELTYEPELIGLGASSGNFQVNVVQASQPPAPE